MASQEKPAAARLELYDTQRTRIVRSALVPRALALGIGSLLWCPYGTLFNCQRPSRRGSPRQAARTSAAALEGRRHRTGGGRKRDGPGRWGMRPYDGTGFPPNRSLVVLRKEVIQPQVLLRLPCYDLVPIIELTFGDFPPCGSDHRLRVLPTLVA
jgi:hypothetical protein